MEELLKKRVAIKDPALLQFFFPQFKIIADLKQPIDYSTGVIFTGTISDSVIRKLDFLTKGRYILISDFADIELYKPSNFISLAFPALKDKAIQYDNYELEDFLVLMKQYYILQKKVPVLKEDETGIFNLYRSLTSSKDLFVKEYFEVLQSMPIKVIVSSILTFLWKVKNKMYNSNSPQYTKILNSAHLKFGSKIKSAVKQYIESKQSPEVALFILLDTLNG